MAVCHAPAVIAKLPALEHFTREDFDGIYEPSDDTWLLCDALLADVGDIMKRAPAFVVEIGPGSGAVCGFLAKTLREKGATVPMIVACDINPAACLATLRTAAANDLADVDTVNSDLLASMRINGSVDVLLFNPPYVPTPSEEVGGNGIAAAWAGGVDGREVIDRVLPTIHTLLSRPFGVLYMLLVEENRCGGRCEGLLPLQILFATACAQASGHCSTLESQWPEVRSSHGTQGTERAPAGAEGVLARAGGRCTVCWGAPSAMTSPMQSAAISIVRLLCQLWQWRQPHQPQAHSLSRLQPATLHGVRRGRCALQEDGGC